MKKERIVFSRSLVAVAVSLAFAPAFADELEDLTNPNTREISISVRDYSKVNPLYRMYTGVNQTANGSLDLNIVNRNDDGLWLKLKAMDLGLTTQEINALAEKQGDWKVQFDYSELTKYAPYRIATKVSGVGTGSLTLNQDFRGSAGPGNDTDLKLTRKGATVSGSKLFADNWRVNFSVKSEDKRGAVMASSIGSTRSGITGPSGGTFNYSTMYFSPRPENYQHNQLEASVDYFTKKFQVSGGYYGSFFNNQNSALNITPGNNGLPTTATASGIPWLSLAPDNNAQQVYLSGAYNFTDSTRGTFKASKTIAKQDDEFIPNCPTCASNTNPSGVPYASGITNTSLGGRVDTTSYATTLTSRFTSNLDGLFSWRYEDRDDKTPVRQYVTGFFNTPESHRLNRGKLELNYRLPMGFRLSGGYEYEDKETPETLRESVTDHTFRVDLRKTMGETLNGSLSLAHSERNGGKWDLPLDSSFPTTSAVTAPLQFADRNRDKARFMLDWSPTEAASFQAYYEYAQDKYPFTPETGFARMGLTKGESEMAGLDASYLITDNWKVDGYYTYSVYKTHQDEIYTPRVLPQTCTTNTLAASCVPWSADLDMNGSVLGAGLKGKMGRWDLTANYLYSKDRTSYGINFNPSYPTAATSSVPSGAGNLPDTTYTINRLHLSGTYHVSKDTSVRVDGIYDIRRMDDYTWSNWTYSDGTRVFVSPKQSTYAIGVTLTQAF